MKNPRQGSRPASAPRRIWMLAAAALVVVFAAMAGCGRRASEVQVASHDASGPEGVRLSPVPATAAARLSASLADPWVKPENCRYEWTVNGRIVPDAVTQTLEPGQFRKHDEVSVRVTVGNPAGGEPRVYEAGIEIVNSPPRLDRVRLLPAEAGAEAGIRAVAEAVDPDGDALTYAYVWRRNGAPIEGAAGATLPLATVGKDDRIEVDVTAHDGEDASTEMRSDVYAVANRPPVFTSSPHAPRTGEDMYRYQALATDPDGDALRYELVKGPAGMSVQPDGLVLWPPVETENEAVEIRARDARGGVATQAFTISHRSKPPAR